MEHYIDCALSVPSHKWSTVLTSATDNPTLDPGLWDLPEAVGYHEAPQTSGPGDALGENHYPQYSMQNLGASCLSDLDPSDPDSGFGHSQTFIEGVDNFIDSAISSTENIQRGRRGRPRLQPPISELPPGLPRQRSRHFRSSGRYTQPMPVPQQSDDGRDPLQRWHESPPETEAATLSAIDSALRQNTSYSRSSESLRSRGTMSRPPSITSLDSVDTGSSSKSTRSTRSSISKPTRSRRSSRQRRSDQAGRSATIDKERRVFPCTFCCDSFKTKYDWSRHEKALHLNIERWVCTPHGGAVVSSSTGRSHCAYCNMLDPSPEHLNIHNHNLCESNPKPPVFNRKDHLVQHLRLVHQLDSLPLIEEWKVAAPLVVSRCGFCDTMMDGWQRRVDHLALHFRQGKTMDDWKGDHCFTPEISAQVTNAIPPYLIGPEAKSVVPFSATSAGTVDHFTQIQQQAHSERATAQNPANDERVQTDRLRWGSPMDAIEPPSTTFIEVLTRQLGNFAREKMMQGIVPTDNMFQNESRRLIYGTEDAWDQTVADNAEWLSSFRETHLQDK